MSGNGFRTVEASVLLLIMVFNGFKAISVNIVIKTYIDCDYLDCVSELSMECSSMISVAVFGPGDQVSNSGWFAVSNSNRKLSFTNNTSV